jgi:hypothetical protein
MDAYILGTHEGDLPIHLLKEGEPGNRIRAMARLEGPVHNVFYALEAPDEMSVDSLTTTVGSSGTTPQKSMVVCLRPPCLVTVGGGPGRPNPNPSYVPWAEMYVFHLFEAETAADAVRAARASLGEDAVAAATDGNGRIMVELSSNDATALDSASAALCEALGADPAAGHAVRGGVLKA